MPDPNGFGCSHSPRLAPTSQRCSQPSTDHRRHLRPRSPPAWVLPRQAQPKSRRKLKLPGHFPASQRRVRRRSRLSTGSRRTSALLRTSLRCAPPLICSRSSSVPARSALTVARPQPPIPLRRSEARCCSRAAQPRKAKETQAAWYARRWLRQIRSCGRSAKLSRTRSSSFAISSSSKTASVRPPGCLLSTYRIGTSRHTRSCRRRMRSCRALTKSSSSSMQSTVRASPS